MIKDFDSLLQKAKSKKQIKVAVVNPVDELSLGGAVVAAKEGIIIPILCGSKIAIQATAAKYGFDISTYEIIDCADEMTCVQTAISLCKTSQAQALMKGKIHTDHLMSGVVKRDTGLRTENQISDVHVMSIPTYHKLLLITDPAINIAPTVEQKAKLIINAVELGKKLGIEKPKVGILSAVETPNEKIQGSMDAVTLVADKSLQEQCIVEGPFAFDNLISKEAAKIKDMKSAISGDIDIVVVPNLEVGNVLFKTLIYLAKAEAAGIILGASVPIILTSRADSAKSRLLSAALASLYV